MSVFNCVAKMKDFLAKSGLSDEISKERVEFLGRRLDAIGADSLTTTEFAQKARDLIANDMAKEAAQKRAADAISMYTRQKNLRDLTANVEAWQDTSKPIAGLSYLKPKDMATEAFRVLQEGGSLRPGQASNVSTRNMSRAVAAEFYDHLNAGLSKLEGLKEFAQSPNSSRETLMALSALDNKTGMTTQNNMVIEYAKVLRDVRDRIFQRMQAVNPYLEQAQDYLWKQMHDRDRITAMGKESWLNLIMEKAGSTSFPEATVPEKRAIFSQIYDRIDHGENGRVAYDDNGYNIQKRGSTSRQIQFNSPSDFADYNAKAGPATLFDGMQQIIQRSSRDIALLDKWGPNPELNRAALVDRFQKSLDPETRAQFIKDLPKLDTGWRAVKGAQNAPAYGVAAKFIEGNMNLQYLVHGGSSVFRSPQDVGMGAALLRSLDGSGMIAKSAEVATNFAKYFVDTDARQRMLGKVGMFAESVQKGLVRDLGSPDTPGVLSSMAQKMGVLNFHARVVESVSASVGHVLTSMLGDVSHLPYDQLPQQWQQGISRYGFNENSWNVARLGTEMINGNKHLTPEGIKALPADAAENFLRKEGLFKGQSTPSDQLMDLARGKMADQLGTMVNEHAQLASARPDVRQRNFMFGDTDINQGSGMLRRLLFEFKAASIVQMDVARRTYLSGAGPKGDLSAVAKLMLTNAAFFAIGDAAKNLAAGKTPEDPTTLNYAGKTVLGSGMGGLYLDTLVDMMNQNSIKDKVSEGAKSLAGPVITDGLQIAATAGQALQGKKGAARGAADAVLGNAVPYQNLPYTKALFDYYIANSIKDMTTPGHARGLEKAARDKGQKYWVGSPTGNSFLQGD